MEDLIIGRPALLWRMAAAGGARQTDKPCPWMAEVQCPTTPTPATGNDDAWVFPAAIDYAPGPIHTRAGWLLVRLLGCHFPEPSPSLPGHSIALRSFFHLSLLDKLKKTRE